MSVYRWEERTVYCRSLTTGEPAVETTTDVPHVNLFPLSLLAQINCGFPLYNSVYCGHRSTILWVPYVLQCPCEQ